MKLNPQIRRYLRLKFAVLLALLAALLMALGLPCVAQDIKEVRILTLDTLQVQAVDGLVVPSRPAPKPSEAYIDSLRRLNADPQQLMVGPRIPKRYLYRDTLEVIHGKPLTLYASPASWTLSRPWWHGLWINTAVLTGAFVSSLFVLELLPEDATNWNRPEIANVPFYKRWYKNVFKLGPHWDGDNAVFNYILHPYAGAAYFMAARTCGFNFWQSMLYSAAISTIGWEFGVEACMERPSYQDIFITPLVGSLLGEGFYRAKRGIVENDYQLLGSDILGHIVAFLLDPVNEVVGALSPRSDCRNLGPGCLSSQPLLIPSPAPGLGTGVGLRLSATF